MAITTVSNVAELYAALAKASGGDTIRLKSGVYDSISLTDRQSFDIEFPSNVTITSANPLNPAEIKSLEISNASNITFDNVRFDTDYAGDQVFYASFLIYSSSNITIKNSIFEGEIATSGAADRVGYATGKGLVAAGNTNLTIENNEFTKWNKGMIIDSNTGVVVRGNEVHNISSDGMDFAHNTSVLIEDNYIHDFFISEASGDHADMIQFWTTGGTSPSTDIIIRGNTLDIGEGDEAQAIFMRNEVVDLGYAGEEMFYQNILIEENVILNGHIHGITVGETDGLVIRNNSVLSVDPDHSGYSLTPQIIVADTSTDVSILNNVTHGISGRDGQTDWSVIGNVFVQNEDPGEDGYFGDIFVTSTLTGGTVSDYTVLPGSEIDELGAGATRLLYDSSPDALTPMFAIQSDPTAEQSLVFDASYTLAAGGAAVPSDAIFHWDFGDGTTGTGQKVLHTYSDAGKYTAKLTITLSDGTEYTDVSDVGVGGSALLAFDGTSDTLYSSGYGEQAAVAGSDSFAVATRDGYALDLGSTKGTPEIQKEIIARFFDANNFKLSMNLQADLPGESYGVVAKMTSSFIVRIEPNGSLKVQIWLDSGYVELKTPDLGLNDGTANDISVELNSKTSTLNILVNGEVVATKAAAGNLPDIGYWDMTLGDSWGGEHFDGKLNSFSLDVAGTDYSTYTPPTGGTEKLSYYGSSDADLLAGRSGSDRMFGYDGDDQLFGGDGHDAINGGGGDDLIYSGKGNDRVYGGKGNDVIHLEGGDDIFIDASENKSDVVHAGSGHDTINGGGGDDKFLGQSGNDTINGGHGNDTIKGGTGSDTLFGGANNDRLLGNAGKDLIDGGLGDDLLLGGHGNDTFVFASGHDVISDFGNGDDDLHLDDALWAGQSLTMDQILAYATTDGTDTVFDFGNGTSLTLENYTDIAGLADDITIF